MNSVLRHIFDTRTVTNGQETFPLHSNVSEEEGVFIQQALRIVRPKSVLEIGMAWGVSTLFFCEELAQLGGRAQLHVIDPHQNTDWHGVGLRNVREAGYAQMVVLYERPSELQLPQLLAEGLEVEFAFIDGWHTFDHTLLDFFYINRMLRVGGVVVFDDVLMPSINRVLRYILAYPAYRLFEITPSEHGPRTALGRLRVRLARNDKIAKWIRRDVLAPAWEVGLDRSAVAVQKIKPDERSWDWYEDF